jgi:hypothetical protein
MKTRKRPINCPMKTKMHPGNGLAGCTIFNLNFDRLDPGTAPSASPSSAPWTPLRPFPAVRDTMDTLETGHQAGPVSRPLRAGGKAYRGVNVLMLWAASRRRAITALCGSPTSRPPSLADRFVKAKKVCLSFMPTRSPRPAPTNAISRSKRKRRFRPTSKPRKPKAGLSNNFRCVDSRLPPLPEIPAGAFLAGRQRKPHKDAVGCCPSRLRGMARFNRMGVIRLWDGRGSISAPFSLASNLGKPSLVRRRAGWRFLLGTSLHRTYFALRYVAHQ